MERILYKRNFLKNVIFRIDFLSDQKMFEQMTQKSNIDELKTRFEILEPLQTIKNTDFTINVDENTLEQRNIETKKYILRKKDQTASLSIEHNAIVIDYTNYSNADTLKEDIKVLSKVVTNVSITRIGLRYINYLECNKFGDINWDLYINSNFLKNHEIDYKGLLMQSITVTDIKYKDYTIRFQHGIHNQNQPADRVKDAFVLDFDAYTSDISSDYNLERIVEEWNNQINYLFEISITQELRKILNDNESELQLK